MPDPRPAYEYPEVIKATVGPGHSAAQLAQDMGIEFGKEYEINAEELWKLTMFFDVMVRHPKPPRKWKSGQPPPSGNVWIMISRQGEGFGQR